MLPQLSLLDQGSPYTADSDTGLVLPRHLNYSITGAHGTQAVPDIPGLRLIEGFLTPEQQAYCVQRVDAADGEWRNDLSRRVQHYGWRYDYKARSITPDMHLGALPDWLAEIARRLYDGADFFDRVPEQVIVNEYLPGQGISTHIDHPGFGPTVCTISLLDDWEMDFSERWRDKSPAMLQQGSCVLLTGLSRSVWRYGIAPRRSELVADGRRLRQRRLSLTFRTVVNRDGPNDNLATAGSRWHTPGTVNTAKHEPTVPESEETGIPYGATPDAACVTSPTLDRQHRTAESNAFSILDQYRDNMGLHVHDNGLVYTRQERRYTLKTLYTHLDTDLRDGGNGYFMPRAWIKRKVKDWAKQYLDECQEST